MEAHHPAAVFCVERGVLPYLEDLIWPLLLSHLFFWVGRLWMYRHLLEKVGTVMRAIGNGCPAFAALSKLTLTSKVPAEHWTPSATCSLAGLAGTPHRPCGPC